MVHRALVLVCRPVVSGTIALKMRALVNQGRMTLRCGPIPRVYHAYHMT